MIRYNSSAVALLPSTATLQFFYPHRYLSTRHHITFLSSAILKIFFQSAIFKHPVNHVFFKHAVFKNIPNKIQQIAQCFCSIL